MKVITIIFVIMAMLLPFRSNISKAEPEPLNVSYHKKDGVSVILDTVSIYNPTVGQCDSDPLITASLAKINEVKLRKGKLRWMALSRDLLKRWNGKFNYGDTVMLFANDAAIDGPYVIQDTMHKRFRKRGDLLFDRSVRKTGLWFRVRISKPPTRL